MGPVMKKVYWFFIVLSIAMILSDKLTAFTPPGPGQSFIYPSPATGNYVYLAFQMAESGNAHLLVYNETGSLVIDQQQSFPAGVQQMLLQNFLLADGAYVYRVYASYDSGNSEKMSGKFAVIH
jgi:hypothetical protein